MTGDGDETPDSTTARYTGLIRVSEALRTYHDTATLFRCLARELHSLVKFSCLGLALYDERTRAIEPRVLEATGETATPPLLTSDEQLTYWVLERQRPLVIPDVAREDRFAQEWPGNVRELRNVLERASILCEGGLITTEHVTFASLDVPGTPSTASAATASRGGDPTHLRFIEKATIERALADARHNKSLAAKRLGLTRKQLCVRLRQHGLDN